MYLLLTIVFWIFSIPVFAASKIVQTKTYEIHFSTQGAIPIQWDMYSNNENYSKPHLNQNKRSNIPFIYKEKNAEGFRNFFKVILYRSNQQKDTQFNQLNYQIKQYSEGKFDFIQFDSPKSDYGLQVKKIYQIPHNGFEIKLTIILSNKTKSEMFFNDNSLKGLGIVLGSGMGMTKKDSLHNPVNVVFKTSEDVVNIKMQEKDGVTTFPDSQMGIEWAGLHNNYYIICVIPISGDLTNRNFKGGNAYLDSRIESQEQLVVDNISNYPTIELFEKPFFIKPGESVDFSYIIFVGPKGKNILSNNKYHLNTVLFSNLWGWLRLLCLALMSLLMWLYSVLNNWGLSIIALSIVMRTITFPVTRYGMKQQKIFKEKQLKLQPFVDEINKKFKDDGDQRYEETMKLYREHNFSPFSSFKGCLWLLVQIPIFIALYQILSQSYEIKGASFLWILDLSLPERLFSLGIDLPFIGSYFNLLPILMCIVQLIQSYMMNQVGKSKPTKKGYGKMAIYIMPITMMILFYSFASGLLIYWTTTNICQVIEQWVVERYGKNISKSTC